VCIGLGALANVGIAVADGVFPMSPASERKRIAEVTEAALVLEL